MTSYVRHGVSNGWQLGWLFRILLKLTRKKTSEAQHYLPFIRGIHRGSVDFPHKGAMMRKLFPCYDVIVGLATFPLRHWVPTCCCKGIARFRWALYKKDHTVSCGLGHLVLKHQETICSILQPTFHLVSAWQGLCCRGGGVENSTLMVTTFNEIFLRNWLATCQWSTCSIQGSLQWPWGSKQVLEERFSCNDDVITCKYFPRCWPFVRGIQRSPVHSPHKGQWRGALMFSLISVWINGWVNNREAGDLRRHCAHYDVIVMM